MSDRNKKSVNCAQDNTSDDEVVHFYHLVSKGIERDSVSLHSDEITDSQIQDASDRREANARNRKLEAEADKLVGENNIRKTVATWSLRFVGFQIAVCDALIAAYIVVNLVRGITVPSEVIFGVLGTSLVEIIGILWVITRSLFPFHDSHRDRAKESEIPSRRRTVRFQ